MATSQVMGRWINGNIGYIGAALAYLVAGIHLFHPKHGFLRLIALGMTGNASLLIYDPRPVAFVLSAFAILPGIKLVVGLC